MTDTCPASGFPHHCDSPLLSSKIALFLAELRSPGPPLFVLHYLHLPSGAAPLQRNCHERCPVYFYDACEPVIRTAYTVQSARITRQIKFFRFNLLQ